MHKRVKLRTLLGWTALTTILSWLPDAWAFKSTEAGNPSTGQTEEERCREDAEPGQGPNVGRLLKS